MTTNKPEVVATIQSKHGDPESFGKRELVASTDMQAMTYGTKLIRLSDYEALQAECEKLRVLLIEIERACSRRDMPSEQAISSWAGAIDAAMHPGVKCAEFKRK